MNDSPRVSVIIPAFNAQTTLIKAIDSVLNQTYHDLECIIVNDGSTDGTGEVVSRYLDSRVVYCEQGNMERSIARNRGVSRARGDYLAFLDADDWWEVDKLEKQLAMFEQGASFGLVYCDVYYVDDDTGRICFRYGQRHRLHQGMVADRLLFQGNFIQSPTPVVPKSVIQHVGYFDPEMPPLEDWDMWLRIAEKYPIGFVAEPLANYRCHVGATSLKKSSERIYRSQLKLLDRYESVHTLDTSGRSAALKKKKSIVHYTYAVALMQKRQYRQAELCLQEALKLNPAYGLIYPRMLQLSLMKSLYHQNESRA